MTAEADLRSQAREWLVLLNSGRASAADRAAVERWRQTEVIQQGGAQHVGFGARFGIFTHVQGKVFSLFGPGSVVIHDQGVDRYLHLKPGALCSGSAPYLPL